MARIRVECRQMAPRRPIREFGHRDSRLEAKPVLVAKYSKAGHRCCTHKTATKLQPQESQAIPFESFRVVVNDQVEDVRERIAKNTSAYCSWTKFRLAEKPDLPLLGEVSAQKILVTLNLFTRNSGRPLLRVELEDGGNRTIVYGRMGVHSFVGIFCGLFLIIPVFEKSAKGLLVLLGGLLVFIGGGYFYERGELLREVATCLEVDIREFKWNSHRS